MKPGQERELKEKRGEIVTHFAYIEDLMKKFITNHYFGTPYHPIRSEVFEDDYFSFGLLFEIFKKLLNKREIKFPTEKLRRLGQLRNIVAHAPVYAKGSGFSMEEISDIYFQYDGKEKNIDDVFAEYDSIKMEVHEAIKEILKPSMDIRRVPEHKGEDPI